MIHCQPSQHSQAQVSRVSQVSQVPLGTMTMTGRLRRRLVRSFCNPFRGTNNTNNYNTNSSSSSSTGSLEGYDGGNCGISYDDHDEYDDNDKDKGNQGLAPFGPFRRQQTGRTGLQLITISAIIFIFYALIDDGSNGNGRLDPLNPYSGLVQQSLEEDEVLLRRTLSKAWTTTNSYRLKRAHEDNESNSQEEGDGVDYRQLAVDAMMATPGWNNANNNLDVNQIYAFAPSEQYQILTQRYTQDPSSMPMPYQSLMTPETQANLHLNPPNNPNTATSVPYTAEQVIQTLPHINHLGFLLRYSPTSDRFTVYILNSQEWTQSTYLHASSFIPNLVRILKKEFQDRLSPGSANSGAGGRDYAVVLSAGDSLKMDCKCMTTPGDRNSAPTSLTNFVEPDSLSVLPDGDTEGVEEDVEDITNEDEEQQHPQHQQQPQHSQYSQYSQHSNPICNLQSLSPIWQFGSGFVHPAVVPTTITMPIWTHMFCFEEYGLNHQVCEHFLEKAVMGARRGVYFGEHTLEVPVNEANDGVETAEGTQESTVEEETLDSLYDVHIPLAVKKTRRLQATAHQHDQQRNLNSNSQSSQSSPATTTTQSTIQVPIYHHLKPQIIWRGTDFSFLNCLRSRSRHWNLMPYHLRGASTAKEVLQALMTMYDNLVPRWKAVTMSLLAEVEVVEAIEAREAMETNEQNKDKDKQILPFMDIKFTPKGRPGEQTKWNQFLSLGANIVTFERMNDLQTSHYKYHIDLGGGGGTTWTGTMAKLALPGLLFHHETSTYDWFHEDLRQWVHYVPVNSDLEDLRERFLWAEGHPEEARKISEAGTAFMKYMGTLEYWERAYTRMIMRIRPSIEAYQPMTYVKQDEQDIMHNNEDDATDTANTQNEKVKPSITMAATQDEEEFQNLATKLGLPLKVVGVCSGKEHDFCFWAAEQRK